MQNIGIVILAAGASTRMGQAKQLLQISNETLLERTLSLAQSSQLGPVMVVLGANAVEIRQAVSEVPFSWVENKAWASGMGSSIRVGLSAILENFPTLEAVLFLLVDQPLIRAQHLQQMVNTWRTTQLPIVAARYLKTLGVPALFARSLFPELLKLHGEKGAKPLLQQYANQLSALELPAAALDLDTPEAWASFVKNAEEDSDFSKD